jgi:predicted P-loop ATPase
MSEELLKLVHEAQEFGAEDGKAEEWAKQPVEGENVTGKAGEVIPKEVREFIGRAEDEQYWRDTRAALAAARLRKSLDKSELETSIVNTVEVLEAMRVDLRYNELEERMEIEGDCTKIDRKVAEIKYEMSKRYRFEPPEDNLKAAFMKVASDHAYHPVVEWLERLPKWDGVKRVEKLFIRYAGADDTELVRAMAEIAMAAAVRRAKQPGCKYDYVPILIGEQGILKSTFILTVAVKEQWYADTRLIGKRSQEVQELVSGKWFYELAEMGGLTERTAEDAKQLITQRVDRGRVAYGHFPIDQKRKGTFWGTKNPKEDGEGFLVDETGNRRFWMIVVRGVIDDGSGKPKIDIEGLTRDLEQLWAEALVIEAAGKELFLPPHLERQAEAAQAAMMAKDEWEPGLRARLEGFAGKPKLRKEAGQYEVCALSPDRWEWRVSSKWLLASDPIYAFSNQFAKLGGRLKKVMTRLGWEHSESIRIGGVSITGYFRRGQALEAEVREREEITAMPVANAPRPPSETEEERRARESAVTDKLLGWVEKHHGPPKQSFVRDGNGWRRLRKELAVDDGLPPKAREISPDGELAAILKMPVGAALTAPTEMAVEPPLARPKSLTVVIDNCASAPAPFRRRF